MPSRPSESRFIPVGTRYGRLEVIGPCVNGKRGIPMLPVRCECGVEKLVIGASLLNGHTQSCGCLHRERASQAMSRTLLRHGDANGGEYKQLYDLWRNVKKRCDSPKYPEFHLYGGRGISYCPSWKEYETFKNWALSAGYQPGLTIERKDVNGNYVPGNCVFIPSRAQAQNRRKKATYRNGAAPTSQYKGVSQYGSKWGAYICIHRKLIALGRHSSEHEAAHAYNVASERLFNQWAVRNDIPPESLSESQREAIRAEVISRLESKGF